MVMVVGDGCKESEKNNFPKEALNEVRILVEEIGMIKKSPEGIRIFDQINGKKRAIGKIFREHPEVRSAYRYQILMERIENGQHFGHYSQVISRAKWLGRIRTATSEELNTIIDCFRNKSRLPFLTVGFKKVWYLSSDPQNKANQALLMALKNLYYRAKEEKEGTSKIS
jgi:hypothetical protein